MNVGLLIGSNSKVFDAMRDAGINARTFRAYRDKYNFVPTVWPVKESVPDAPVTLSIRPVPDDLLAGRLDDQLKALIASAPPGVKLSAFHEASNLSGYPDFVTAGAMRAVHEYMQELCRGSNVRYGSIICAVPSSVRDWMGTGLDWYGLDVYDFGEGQFRHLTGGISKPKLFARLDDMLATSRELAGRDAPEIDICETNSPRIGHRAEWFTLLAEWMSANGGGCLQTFWNPSGSLSGPWLPDDQRTIDALRAIAAANLPGRAPALTRDSAAVRRRRFLAPSSWSSQPTRSSRAAASLCCRGSALPNPHQCRTDAGSLEDDQHRCDRGVALGASLCRRC